jgi:hypothetical protein
MRSLVSACWLLIGPMLLAQQGEQGHGGQDHGEADHGNAGHEAPKHSAAPSHAPATNGKGEPVPPTHAARFELEPAALLRFVEDSYARAPRARDKSEPVPAPLPRPSGAGRYVCAVISCADAGIEPARVLGLDPSFVLVIQNAGAMADRDAADLLAWAQKEHDLSLCFVLSHERCASLGATSGTRDAAAQQTTRRAEERSRAAREVAAARRIRMSAAHAMVQREQLLAALADAPSAHASCEDGAKSPMPSMRVVPALVNASTLRNEWLSQRIDSLPIAPVR